MKKLYVLLLAAAVLLSDIMCAVVAYTYRDIVCGTDHLGYSAPPSAAFLYALPFLAGIFLCLLCAWMAYRKMKK